MTRLILVPNDLLTPFDLKAQNFMIDVEFSTYHRGQNIFSKKCPRVTLFCIPASVVETTVQTLSEIDLAWRLQNSDQSGLPEKGSTVCPWRPNTDNKLFAK